MKLQLRWQHMGLRTTGDVWTTAEVRGCVRCLPVAEFGSFSCWPPPHHRSQSVTNREVTQPERTPPQTQRLLHGIHCITVPNLHWAQKAGALDVPPHSRPALLPVTLSFGPRWSWGGGGRRGGGGDTLCHRCGSGYFITPGFSCVVWFSAFDGASLLLFSPRGFSTVTLAAAASLPGLRCSGSAGPRGLLVLRWWTGVVSFTGTGTFPGGSRGSSPMLTVRLV